MDDDRAAISSMTPLPGGAWAGLLLGGLSLHTVVAVSRPMASYRALELGVTPAMLGLLAASYAILPVLVAVPAGRRTDANGTRRVLVLGMVVLTAAACALPLLHDLGALLVVMALLGLGHLLALIGMQAVVAQRYRGGELDRRYGWFSMTASAGQLVGPVLAGLLAGQGGPAGTTRAFVAGAVVACLGLVSLVLLRGTDDGQARTRGTAPLPVSRILRSPGVPAAMVTSLSVLAATDIITVYLPALGAERGWSARAVGVLLGVRAAGSMLARLWLGRMVDVTGRERLLAGSLLVSAAAVVCLAFSHQVLVAGAACLLAGLVLGIGQPLSMAVVATRSPEGTQGTALSVRLMANRIGQVAIPAAAGVVAATTATSGVLVAAAAVVAVSAACLRLQRS